MSGLADVLAERQETERRLAVRSLLRTPLLRRADDAEAFAAVVRHRDHLADWFHQHLGWTLLVDASAGFCRLLKVPARPDGTRAAEVKGRPFDRRRYALLCLTVAVLDRKPGAQTTLKQLADDLAGLSREEAGIEAFDPKVFSDRRAFVDVLKWLVSAGVLGLRDGDAEGYAPAGQGDALFDLHERVLAHLLAAPSSPSLASGPEELLHGPTYADTDEQARLRARHEVLRRLLDDPVVYYDDLTERERDWLVRSLGFVGPLLERDGGFVVERRREGLAAVDPEGQVTDLRFPDGGSSLKHAALLLAEQLAERARQAPGRDCVLSLAWVERAVRGLIKDYGERCNWRGAYREKGGAALLAREAVQLLEAMGLVRLEPEGVRPRPAVARFVASAADGTARGRRR